MKKVILLFVLFVYSFSFAQDNYKYVIVPKKFSFFKEENKYNLNSMTKSFFEKEGFQVFFDTDVLPNEFANNRCMVLFANAIENNNMFNTKIVIEIKDCFNKVIFLSNEGSSKEKDFKTAYTLAFREALSSMTNKLNFKKTFDTIANTATVETKVIADKEISKEVEVVAKNTVNTNQLFAIPTETGYKLVDAAPKTIMTIHKTSQSEVFIAEKDSFSGVFIKKINGWFFEYYQNEILVSEKVEVKF